MVSDKELLQAADVHFKEDRLLQSARLLRQVKATELLEPNHEWILKKSIEVESIVEQLIAAPDETWNKQGESHGHRDTMIYYQMNGNKLTARLETPIEPNLLVPLLSVFNESSLYSTWLPRWERPMKLGIRESVLLRQSGRCSQLINVVCDCPWPLATRELIINAVAVDDIDKNGAIVVRMDNGLVDEEFTRVLKANRTRVDFDGGILFRKCPSDHPAFKNSKIKHDGDMVLVCLSMHVDPKIAYVPASLTNFVTRSVLGKMWEQLLKVAEEVLDGNRPQHANAIQEKREFIYDWVDERANVMLKRLANSTQVAPILDTDLKTSTLTELF